jgi:hypothetical protein
MTTWNFKYACLLVCYSVTCDLFMGVEVCHGAINYLINLTFKAPTVTVRYPKTHYQDGMLLVSLNYSLMTDIITI